MSSIELLGESDEAHQESPHVADRDDRAPGPPTANSVPKSQSFDIARCARWKFDAPVCQRVSHEPHEIAFGGNIAPDQLFCVIEEANYSALLIEWRHGEQSFFDR